MNHLAFDIFDHFFYDVRCAAEVTDGSQYFVLLMITDGVISDMAQTKESVVNVSRHNLKTQSTES